MEKTAAEFGGIDILVNNASAINLASTESVSMKGYDLMHNINTRGYVLMLAKKRCHFYVNQIIHTS